MALFSKFFQSSNPRPLIQSSPTLHTGSEWTPEDFAKELSSTTTTKTPQTWHEALSLVFSQKDSESANPELISLSSVTLTFSDGSRMLLRELDGNPLELLLHGKSLILKEWHHGDEKGFVALPSGYSLLARGKKVSFIHPLTYSAITELLEMSGSMGQRSLSASSKSSWQLQLFLVIMFLILVVGAGALSLLLVN